MPIEKSDLLQGTLDMLILKIVELGPIHGYGISQRIKQISKEVLKVQQGSLYPALHRLEKRGWLAAERAEARVVRCVFGNPFRPCQLDPAWLARNGDALRGLAEALYVRRRLPAGTFDPLLVVALANAIEKAGCADETVLRHLRGGGPHVRGCWPVDLLRNKE